MPDMETLLAEMFAFQRFERDESIQNLINDTLSRYDDDLLLTFEDLADAAGGLEPSPPDIEGSSDK